MIPHPPRVPLPSRRTLETVAGVVSRAGIATGSGMYFAGVLGVADARAPLMMAGAATTSMSMLLYNHVYLKPKPLEVPPEAHDAMNILTVYADEPEHEELMTRVGRNRMNVTDHLMDVVTDSETHPAVREAVSKAGSDPEQIIRKLLELVEQDPPILSQRPTSRAQPAVAAHDAV